MSNTETTENSITKSVITGVRDFVNDFMNCPHRFYTEANVAAHLYWKIRETMKISNNLKEVKAILFKSKKKQNIEIIQLEFPTKKSKNMQRFLDIGIVDPDKYSQGYDFEDPDRDFLVGIELKHNVPEYPQMAKSFKDEVKEHYERLKIVKHKLSHHFLTEKLQDEDTLQKISCNDIFFGNTGFIITPKSIVKIDV
jgi:hypothetical protein